MNTVAEILALRDERGIIAVGPEVGTPFQGTAPT